MKYYLLLAVSLPILSTDNSAVLIERLTPDEITEISERLPIVTAKNLKKEIAAADRLEKHIQKCHEVLKISYQLKFERLKLLKMTDKKSPEHAELGRIIAKHDAELIKAQAHFKNIKDIHQSLAQRIEKFKKEQQAKERIKSLIDAIAGVGDRKLIRATRTRTATPLTILFNFGPTNATFLEKK